MSNAPATDVEAAVLASIDKEETLILLRRAVETPSDNPPGNEQAVAELLAETLAAGGIAAQLDDVHPGRPNLEAAYGTGDRPRLLLNGHTDTMPAGAGWSDHPHRAITREGRVYGLGACDMKAGIVAMVEALLAVKRAGVELRGTVLLDAVIDEEDGGSGTKRTITRGRTADWAIIAEPTELDIVRLGNGQVNFEVDFHGRAGHGSTPELGHNAIYDAAAFVRLVENEATHLTESPYPLIGAATYSVGTIQGGLRTSIVPSRCTVSIDRRIVPGQTPGSALADLEELLVAARSERPHLRHGDPRITCSYAPFEVAEDSRICDVLRKAASEAARRDARFVGMRATTDAVFLCEAGIPTVVFGPGSIAQAHRPDEFVAIDELHSATRTLALAIVRLLT